MSLELLLGRKTEKKLDDFLRATHNLIDKEKITIGKRINQNTGEIEDHNSYSISSFIEVLPKTDYHVNQLCAIRRYDYAENYLGGTINITGSFNTGSATKIRLVMLNSGITNLQLVKGDSPLPYEEYGNRLQASNMAWMEKKVFENHTHDESFAYLPELPPLPFEMEDLFENYIGIEAHGHSCVGVKSYSVRWRNCPWSLKIQTTNLTAVFNITYSDMNFSGVSEIILIAYIEDVDKVSRIGAQVGSWSRTELPLKNGWNVVRLRAFASDISRWEENKNTLRLLVYPNAPTTVYFAKVVLIRKPKAQILFINDHGYSSFKELAYPELRLRGIPTTWAINPGRLGQSVSNAGHILTQGEIDELASDPMSEFSYHAWNPTERASANMNELELLEEHHKCTLYLKRNGILPRFPWRAAFTQNLAPSHKVLQPYVDAYGTPTEAAAPNIYPFYNPYDVARVALHSRDNAVIDDIFNTLRKTSSLLVCYTHGVSESGGIHWTPGKMQYFLGKVDQAISDGWLEGTTYSKLRGQYRFENIADVL